MRLPLRIAESHQSGRAPVDQLVEFVARDDALVGGPPCLIVRRGDVGQVGGLGSANFYEGRTHFGIEAMNFAAFKPYN